VAAPQEERLTSLQARTKKKKGLALSIPLMAGTSFYLSSGSLTTKRLPLNQSYTTQLKVKNYLPRKKEEHE